MSEETQVETEETEAYQFDDEFQKKIAALVLRDSVFAQKTEGLISPEYFENEVVGAVVGAATEFFGTYKKAPSKSTIKQMLKKAFADRKIRQDLVEDVKATVGELLKMDISDGDFVAEEVATFARHQAITNAIMKSVHYLDKGRLDEIDELITSAAQVGLSDISDDYDYFEEIDNRTTERKALAAGTIKPDGITTGTPEIDKRLYHEGWGRKELSVIMGAAKAGKSMSLGHFAACASMAGHNVLYVTLENSSKITADRLDANFANVAISLLKDKPMDVQQKIKAAQKKAAKIKILNFASGTMKPSMLRRALNVYRARGIIFDLIVVDYADIMAPERYSNDLREDMRLIYLDLRAIAHEQNAAVLTATQTNRDGAKNATAKMTDVADDFNKIRTADIVLSINATEPEIQAGEARIYFAASRNTRSGYTIRIQTDRSTMKFVKKVLGEE